MRRPLPTIDDPERDAAASRIAAAREVAEPPLLYRMLLHSPPVALGWDELGRACRSATTLDPRLRELVITSVATLTGCTPEIATHARLAVEAGAEPATVAGIGGWRTAPGLDDRDRAALDLAEAVTVGAVEDEHLDAADTYFDARQVVELVTTASYYVAVSRFIQALDVDPATSP